MARSNNLRSIKLRQTVAFEFVRAPFVPFQSLGTLDVERLARARHEVVEFGQFESDCCKRTARAVVKNGQVTEIKLDARAGAKSKLTPVFAKLLARAQKRLGSPAPRLPMPVSRFFRRNTLGIVTINTDVVDGATCYTVCVDFFGTLLCTTCCGTSPSDVACLSIRSGG